MNKNVLWGGQFVYVIAATTALVAIESTLVFAQSSVDSSVGTKRSPVDLVKILNGNSDAALREAESQWRTKFARLRNSGGIEGLAGRLGSFQQKFEMAGEFLGLGANSDQLIRETIRVYVVDERELVRQMREFADGMLLGLCAQDRTVLQSMGMSVYANRGLCSPTYDPRDWDQAFEPFIAAAHSLSRTDLARSTAIFTGSNLASDAINDSARSAGINPYKDGTVADFFADLFVNVAVGFVVDAVTDSTPSIERQLSSELESVEQALLNGPKGLLTSLRSATEQHKQARLRLVGLDVKGGAK